MVEWVWTVYAPGGISLSVQERKETYEEFDKWRRTGKYWERKLNGGSKVVAKAMGKKLDPARAVSFLEFRSWFLHLTTYLEHLREAVVYWDDTPTTSAVLSEQNERYISFDPV